MQLQQRRFAGDLPVKPNKYLEQWATRREHVENDFKWNGRTLSTLAIFGFGVPYVIYSTRCEPSRSGLQVWGGRRPWGGGAGRRDGGADRRAPRTAELTLSRAFVLEPQVGRVSPSEAGTPKDFLANSCWLHVATCSVKEFDHVDEVAGRPKRDMWGSKA